MQTAGVRRKNRQAIVCNRHKAHRRSWRLQPMLAIVLSAIGAGRACAAGLAANVITPDGRTATSLAVHGTVTDIRTGTVSGDNAFNAFSRFQVAAGRTVNLDLPTGTHNLINIVTGAATTVDGTINSISQGHIGGHVFFADPYGLVVGRSGAMNVGSLTVTTPTQSFLRQLVSSTGVVNAADTATLLAGRAPQSPDGVVIVDGKIRALDAVDLHAGIVHYAGTATVGADAAGTIFRHVVNVSGIHEASGMTESQGRIVITGATQVSVAGTLKAGGAVGGTIRVTAPHVDLASTARLDASGPAGGGIIGVGVGSHGTVAADTTTIAHGAILDASAGIAGNGGSVTVLSQNGTDYAGAIRARGGDRSGNGGQVEVSATHGIIFDGLVNTGAPHGLRGNLLLDPTNLFLVDGSASSSTSNVMTVGALQALGNTNITLSATNEITIGSSTGAAANVDLSGLLAGNTLTLDAGGAGGAGDIVFNSGSSIETGGGNVALNAGTGFSGAAAGTGGGLVTLGSITAPGATIAVTAANGIVVSAAATVSASSTAAGQINLTAPVITADAGSALDALSSGTTASGVVALDATTSQSAPSGLVSTTSSVTLDGTVSADTINATATASATSSYSGSGASGYATLAGNTVLSGQGPGLSLYYVDAQANAGLTVGASAVLTGGTISLSSQASETAKSLDLALTSASGIVLPVTYGNVTGTADVTVAGGATIDATKSLTVAAHNNDTLSASAIALTTSQSAKGAAALAIGVAHVNTTAVIAGGAHISGGDVTIAADNQNSLSTSATAMANNAGLAGIGLSIADYNVNATARDSANVGTAANPVGNVLVQAQNITTNDANAASASSGSNFLLKYAFKAASGANTAISNFALSRSGSALGTVSSETPSASAPGGGSGSSGGTSVPFKVAGAMAFTTSNINSSATIAADPTQTGATAPVVDSGGTVAVVANTVTSGVRSNAAASVNSETAESAGTSTNPSTPYSVSAGIAIGFFTNTAHATIGNGTTIDAAHVGVASTASLPISVTWWPSDWTSPTTVISNLMGKANGTLGLNKQVITSGSTATAQSTSAQLAGAVDWLQTNNSSLAFIGDGATIDATGTSGSWNATGYALTGTAPSWSFGNTVAVQATGIAQSIDVGGNVGLTFFGTQGGSNASAGGAFQGVWYQDSTIAGIGNAVINTTHGGVAVNAGSQDTVIALLPSAGSGSGFGVSGALSFLNLDETTHASVSSGAQITAAQELQVNAVQALQLLNIAGSVQLSNSAGVGVGIAVNSIKTDTAAYIGDNAADDPSTQSTLAGGGLIQAGSVAVTAASDGQMLSLSVSGAKASGSNTQSANGSGGGSGSSPTDIISNIPSYISAVKARLTGNATTAAAGNTGANAGTNELSAGQGGSSSAAGTSSGTPGPKFGLSVAGSASVNVSNVSTKAYVDGANIELPATVASGNGGLLIQALNETTTVAASGGGALTLSGQGSSQWSAAVSAAFAINILGNTTSAALTNSAVSNVQNAAITAATGGEAVSVALGIAANTNSSSTSGEGAGSVSLTLAQSTVSATDTTSTLSGLTGTSASPSLDITAYDQTAIGDGGGAFFGGGKAGVGVAFSYNEVDNTLTAALTGGSVTAVSSVSVQALDATQILTMALVGAVSTNTGSGTGAASLAINDIGNTDKASITGGATVSGGTVTVSAQSGGTNSALTTLLTSGVGAPSASDTGMSFNFSGSPLPAFSGSAIVAIAGNIQVSGNNVGLSVVYNSIHSNYDATIADSTVTAIGAVNVKAADQATIIGLAVGGGVATGNFAGVGSITVNQIADGAVATIGNSADTQNLTTVSAGSLDEQASNGGAIWSLAGNIAYSKGVAAGAAVSYNSMGNTTSADVQWATVTVTGAANEKANNSAAIHTLAAAGVGSQGVALGGALSWNAFTNTTQVEANHSTLNALSWTAKASETGSILAIAGDAAVSTGSAAVGIGLSVNTIGDTTEAALTDSTLAIPTAALTAVNSSTIQAVAAGGAISAGSVAVGGANTDNVITNSTTASASNISGSTAGLTVAATDSSTIQSLAGQLAVGSDVGVGGAVSANSIDNTVTASLGGTLGVTGTAAIAVTAQATGVVQSLGVVGSAGGAGAGSGAATGNNIGTNVRAGLNTVSLSDTNASVAVSAQNDATIDSGAAGAAGAGTGAVGVAIAVNRIGGTTHAYVHGGDLVVRDLTVGAATANGISTTAAGVAVSGEVSAAGSLATNVLTGATNADIDQGAQVAAFNNIGVTAEDANIISAATGALAIGGATAGIGLGVTVNVLNDSTNAFIGDSGTTPTSVTALAQGTGLLTVANGALTKTPSVQNLKKYKDYVTPGLAEGTLQVHGLAVNAESLNAVSGLATSVSMSFDPAGSAALNADAVTNVLGGTTSAYAQNANINQTGTPAAGQTVSILASRHDFGANLVFGAAAGATDVAASAAVGVNTFNGTTNAYLLSDQTSAAGAVTVTARSSQDSLGLAAGLSAGIVGAAGTGLINIFKDNTNAYVAGGQLDGGSLAISAQSRAAEGLVTGTISGGAAGLAATVLVVDGQDSTQAWLGESGLATTVNVTGASNVSASSLENLETLAVSGAVGGAAFAGQVAVLVLQNTTTATVQDAKLTAQTATVSAIDNTSIQSYAGALAAGYSAGIGIGANVVVLGSTVAAAINNAQVATTGAVLVQAQSTKSIALVSATAGLSAGFSGAGAVGLILAGSASGGQALTALNGSHSLSTVSSVGTAGNSAGGDSSLTTSEQTSVSQSTTFDASAAVTGPVPDGTTASIAASGVSAGSVAVTATDSTTTSNIAGAVSVGALGVGAGVAVTTLNDTVAALISGSQVTASSVSVLALTHDGTNGPAVSVTGYAGGAGPVFGLGAAIAVGTIGNAVTATVNAAIQSPGGLTVSAQDGESVTSSGVGAAAGAGAVGVVVGDATRQSTVSAVLGGTADANSVQVTAQANGAASANVTGAAAGIVSGTGAAAAATDADRVTAEIAPQATIQDALNGITVQATDTPQASANALGVSVAATVGLGLSIAVAQVTPVVNAFVATGANLAHDTGLNIVALIAPPATSAGAAANATAGTGGLLVGAGAATATALDAATVNAYTGTLQGSGSNTTAVNGIQLPNGTITVSARDDSSQESQATGVSAGLLALGASVASSQSTATTYAGLGTNTTVSPQSVSQIGTGTIAIQANGNDTNYATTIAGSGGVLAGDAAVATTKTAAVTIADIGASSHLWAQGSINPTTSALTGGAITVSATHTTHYFASADSVNAAAAGASGAFANNTLSNTTVAEVDPNATLQAMGTLDITAANTAIEDSQGQDSVDAGAGGLLNGTAAVSQTTITESATALIGAQAQLVSGLDPFLNTGGILVTADNTVESIDQAILNSGGAIEGAGVNSTTTVSETNAVTVGDKASFFSYGMIGLGTYSLDNVQNAAYAHTWGVAGVASANATSDIQAQQSVTLGNDVTMLGYGSVTLSAGESGDGLWTTDIAPSAVAQSYVRGLIAIPTADATAAVGGASTLTTGTGDVIDSGRNIYLFSYRGTNTPTAHGTGHGYELEFIPVTDGSSNPSMSLTSAVNLAGTFVAGYFHNQSVTVNAAGSVSESGAPVNVVFDTAFSPQNFFNSLSSAQVADAGSAAINLLKSYVSATPVTAAELSPLYAAAGNVTVHASGISGAASLTAYGAPQITVVNDSPDYLLVDGAYIPAATGGNVYFTGAAGTSAATAAGLSINQVNAGGTPSISMTEAYNGAVGTGDNNEGPALFLTGAIEGVTSDVKISNVDGSFGEFGTITALEQIIDIPNGAFVTYLPGQTYHSGTSPEAAWYNYLNTVVLPQSPDQAVVDIVNATFNSAGTLTADSLTYATLWQTPPSQPFTDTYDQSKDTPDGNTTSGESDVVGGLASDYFGDCMPAVGSGCASSSSASPASQTYSGGPGSGSGYDYPLIPTATLSYTQSSYNNANLSGASGSVTNSGGPIGIVAEYIDINSRIVSGQPTNWSVSLPATLNGELSLLKSIYDQYRALGFSPAATYVLPSQTLNAGDQPITATYNAATNQITLNAVHAAGGGFVMLDGGIISTDPNGQVSINDGYGQVVVNNQTVAPVVVNNIDTGIGAIGEVKIIDTLQPAKQNRWWYLYQQGGGLSIYNNSNGATSLANAQLVTHQAGGSTDYNPAAGLRYQWSETTHVTRTYNSSNFTVSNWSWANASGQATQTAHWSSGSGSVITGSNNTNPFSSTLSGSASGIDQAVVYHGCSGDSSCHYSMPEWQYFDIITSGTLTATNSVYASNPIAINFSNSQKALVSVTSPAGVILDGQILNPDGLTAIDATGGSGTITQASTASLSTASLLLAAGGDIGSSAQALTASLGAGGYVSAASSNGAIHLDLGSGAQLTDGATTPSVLSAPYLATDITASDFNASVAASGNVDITAAGTLSGGAGSYVYGNNINLVSLEGSIGSSVAPLTVEAVGTANGAGGLIGGVVNASATGSIGLNADGNLVVGQILSGAGNVYVTASGGIFDARAETPADTLSQAQMQTVWTSLKTLEEPTTTSGQAAFTKAVDQTSISSFESLAQANFAAYQRLINPAIGTVQGTTLSLTKEGVTLFTPIAAAAGMTPAAYAQSQYASLTGFFSSHFGSQWASVLAPVAQGTSSWASFWASNTNPSTATDSTLATQLTNMTKNAGWTADELTYELDNQALAGGTGTLVGSASPNVSGHNVTLIAHGSDIGTTATPVTVSVSQIIDGTLSSTQAAALALATLPGEVTQSGTGSSLLLTITQTAPLFVNATGTLAATSSGNVFIQSAGSLTLAGITAAGNAVLAVSQGMSSAVGPGLPAITVGGNLALTAGTGSIGGASSPIEVDVKGQLSAAAGDSAYVTELAGNLTLAQVSALNALILNATHGSLVAAGLLGLTNAAAYSVTLNASGDIGTPGDLLTVRPGAGGLTATAGGYIGLNAPLAPNALTGTFNVNSIRAGGALDIATGEDLSAGTLLSGGSASLSVAGNATIQTIRSGGAVNVTTAGDMALGTLTTTEAPGTATLLVDLTAGGDIVGNATGVTTITATGAGSETQLTAGSGIGTAGSPLVVDLPWLTATSVNGPIAISDLMGLDAPSLQAQRGLLDVTAQGPMTLGTATAYADLALAASGPLSATTLSAGGNATVTASGATGAINVGTFGADNGALQTTGDMTLGSATARGTLSLLAANIYGDTITTGGLLSATATAPAGVIDLRQVGSPEVALATRGALVLPSLTLQNGGDFSAGRITLGIRHPYSNTLSLGVTGFGNGVARRVSLTLNSLGPVLFSRLFARNATIMADANPITIADGQITDTLTLWTPQRSIYMNNVDPALQRFDIQLYQPSTLFTLSQLGSRTVTSAYISNYGFKVDGTVDDYDSAHNGSSGFFTGSSGLNSGGSATLGLIGANSGTLWQDIWGRLMVPPLPTRGRHMRVVGSGVEWRNRWGL